MTAQNFEQNVYSVSSEIAAVAIMTRHLVPAVLLVCAAMGFAALNPSHGRSFFTMSTARESQRSAIPVSQAPGRPFLSFFRFP
jgi:hypothetical protein